MSYHAHFQTLDFLQGQKYQTWSFYFYNNSTWTWGTLDSGFICNTVFVSSSLTSAGLVFWAAVKLGAVKVDSRRSSFSFSLCVAVENIRRTLPFKDRTKTFLMFFKAVCLSNKRQHIPVEVAMMAAISDSSGFTTRSTVLSVEKHVSEPKHRDCKGRGHNNQSY